LGCEQENKGMNAQEQLDRLTGIVESLASSVVAHDRQIVTLMEVARKASGDLAEAAGEDI
jgi:hypothetical protein